VRQHQAIDFIAGRRYAFKGDSSLLSNNGQSRYHLQPSRTLHRVAHDDSMRPLLHDGPFYHFSYRSLLVIDNNVRFRNQAAAVRVDHIVLSHNAPVSVQELTSVFSFSSIIIDASNSHWKTSSWMEDCRRLGIACHPVAADGAFVLTLH
jgi:competence protein ComEC